MHTQTERINIEDKMYLTKERIQELTAKFGKNDADTGAADVQVALFTERINHLTEHLKANRQDFSTQRALQMLVGKRRKLLDFIKKHDIARYRGLIEELNLRK